MNQLLIGTIIVLILLALIPIKSESFEFTNLDQVTATVDDDTEEMQSIIHLAQSNLMANTEFTEVENVEEDYNVAEIEQEMTSNDRVIFISIGSILLFGILLLLPLHVQKF